MRRASPYPGFHAMRQRLLASGLSTADFSLTEAGHVYAGHLIAMLEAAEAPAEPVKPAVKWNTRPRFWKTGSASDA